MKRIIFLSVIIFVLLSLSQQKALSAEKKRVYFKVKDNKALSLITRFLRHDLSDNVFSIEAPSFIIENLKNESSLEYRGEVSLWQVTELPFDTSNNILKDDLFSHKNISASCTPSSEIPWGITKVNGGSGGDGIKVAVLDTGAKTDHPDLKNNIVDCRDAQTSRLSKRCSDNLGHGTHVAGTIAANGKIKGVAPNAKLMVIKVCSDRGYCWGDDIARGIRYAADNGANIINMSLGGSSISQDERNAIDYAVNKNVLVVAAAGNSGPSDNTINYPGAYLKVVAVGATDSSDTIANFSSRGNNTSTTPFVVEERDIEFAAPGVSVESTARNGCYTVYSGTSMATPHVAGLAAKLWSEGGGSAVGVRSLLWERAKLKDLSPSGDDNASGFGFPTAP